MSTWLRLGTPGLYWHWNDQRVGRTWYLTQLIQSQKRKTSCYYLSAIPLPFNFWEPVSLSSPVLSGKSPPTFPVGFQVAFVLAAGWRYYLLFSLLLPVPNCCFQLRHLLPASQDHLAPGWIPFLFLPRCKSCPNTSSICLWWVANYCNYCAVVQGYLWMSRLPHYKKFLPGLILHEV